MIYGLFSLLIDHFSFWLGWSFVVVGFCHYVALVVA
jgi:hypothetical protein